MNKAPENILLYSVSVSDRLITGICIECKVIHRKRIDMMEVEFEFYDYISLEINSNGIAMCQDCFSEVIKEKSLKYLFKYIVLLKMKGKRVDRMDDPYDPNEAFEMSFCTDKHYKKHYYHRLETKENTLKFIKRARKYNDG